MFAAAWAKITLKLEALVRKDTGMTFLNSSLRSRATSFGQAVLAAGAAALLGLSGAHAGSLNAYNPYSGREGGTTLWDSYYGGFNVGFGLEDSSMGLSGANLAGTRAIGAGTFPQSLDVTSDGFVAGGQIGVNTRFSGWVYGVELDMAFSGLSGSKSAGTANGFTVEQSVNWLSTLRGRVGVLVTPAMLVYATGGFAFGETELNASYATGQKSDTKISTGFAAGGGLEYAFNPWISLKGEYLYVDLGTHRLTVIDSLTTPALDVRTTNSSNLLRAGVNYKF